MKEKGILLTRVLNLAYLIPALFIIFVSYPKEVNLYDRAHQRFQATTRISTGEIGKSMFSLNDDNSYLPLKWISAPLSFALFAFAVRETFNPIITPWPFYFLMCGSIFVNLIIVNAILIKILNRNSDY